MNSSITSVFSLFNMFVQSNNAFYDLNICLYLVLGMLLLTGKKRYCIMQIFFNMVITPLLFFGNGKYLLLSILKIC